MAKAFRPTFLQCECRGGGALLKVPTSSEPSPTIFPDFTPKTAYQWIVTSTTNDKLRSSVFLFKCPAGLQAGDVMRHVYTRHKFAIANLSVHGHDLLRISPTFCNTARDVHDVVDAVVDVILAMQQGKLAGLGHGRGYA
jgi:hypothetical protein